MPFPPAFSTLVSRLGLAAAWLVGLSQVALLGAGNFPSAADGFDPNVNGNVFALATQTDGRILVAGSFSALQPNGGAVVTRNNVARLNIDGSLDLAFNPNPSGPVNTVVVQADGKILVGGAFTSIGGTARNNVARLNVDGSLDATFDPNANGPVKALALQADGKIIVGGAFTSLKSTVARNRVARLHADGTVDSTFNPNANNIVFALAVQADGKILVGGGFTTMQPNGAGAAVTRNRAARLNPDGSLDAKFDPGANNLVAVITLQLDGRILLGGNFTALQPNGAAAATASNHLARFNADGTFDTVFSPNPSGNVTCVTVQPDGRILIGGYFITLSPGGVTNNFFNGGQTVPIITNASLTASGRVGTPFSFAITASGSPTSYTASPLPAGLSINTSTGVITGTPTTAGTTAVQLGATNSIGTGNATLTITVAAAGGAPIITNSNPLIAAGVVGTPFSFTITASGSPTSYTASPLPVGLGVIAATGVITGTPTSAGTTSVVLGATNASGTGNATLTLTITAAGVSSGAFTRPYFARINIDGSFDPTFDAGANYVVSACVIQADGQILVGGYFSQLLSHSTNAIATIRNHLARVNADGSLDITFDPNTRGGVLTTLVQSDGKILIGGTFTSIGGTTRNNIARLNADSTLDTSFNPNANGRVLALALQADGKIIIAGSFTNVGASAQANADGSAYNNIARLNPDGSPDRAFNPNANAQINAVVVQPDGKILIGGFFTTLQPYPSVTATTRNYLARLNPDGSIDTTFADASPRSQVLAIQLQNDGKILLAGNFSTGGTPTPTQILRNYLARLNSNGTLDAGFDPNANLQANALALQSDGKIIIGGTFTFLQPNGAKTATTRNHIARLNADGSLDPNFDPNVDSTNAQIYSLVVQSDGKLLVGGAFSSIGANVVNNFARLNVDGSLDTSFKPNPSNPVQVARVQSDGKIIIGGSFVSLQPLGDPAATTPRLHLARLNAGGAIDTAFNAAVGGQSGGQVTALAVQADGRIIMAGTLDNVGGAASSNLARFNSDSTPDTIFNPNADGAINTVTVRATTASVSSQTPGFAWLNSDGSLRSGFTVAPEIRFTGDVTAIARQPDGKVIIGSASHDLLRFNADGSLDRTFNPNPNGGIYGIGIKPNGQIIVVGAFTIMRGVTRNRVALLNADGSVDPTFDPNANDTVYALLIQPDGKIVFGGAFIVVQPNSSTTSIPRRYIARVFADGTLDTSFNPNPDGRVNAIALQADGKFLLGGAFTSIYPFGQTSATTRNRIGRLNADGTLDSGFDPNANAGVSALVVQSDGMILAGGAFTMIGGTTRNRIVRIAPDGTVDASFNPGADGQVSAISLQPDKSILIAGSFTTVSGVARNRIARLGANGLIDTSFNPNANNQVDTIALQTDGTIMIGGAFTALKPNGALFVGGAFSNLGGAVISNLALLNDDGTPTTNFRPNPNGTVYALAPQTDGRTLVAGAFTSFAGTTRNRVARLNPDASIDTAFNPNANNQANALALQPDGRILVGGTFTTIGGATRNRLARLNPDGSLDTFNPGVDGPVNAVTVQADGRILIGGAFSSVGGAARSRLARLNADGSVDAAFDPGADGPVNAIIVQADGRILIGGAFTNIGGAARSRLARLNADGSIDASFDPGPDNTVNALALQADGRLLVGGSFAQIGGLARYRFARLGATSVAAQSISVNAGLTTLTWSRGGSAPELSAVALELSTDGSTWTSLGQAARVGATSNWQLGGLSLPGGSVLYARARGIVPTSQYGSTGGIESVRLLLPAAAAAGATTLGALTNTANAAVTRFSATGLPAGLSIDPETGIISGTPLQTGAFEVAISATNSGGTNTTRLTLPIAAASNTVAARLAALSARARVSGGNPLITGFVISGTESRSVLLRAIGPGQAALGVQGALANPVLRLYDAGGQLLLQAGRWEGKGSLAVIFSMVGAFPLAADSADAASVVTLPPGVYTAQVTDADNLSGVALAEIYEIGAATAGATRLIELSARGSVETGEGVLIGGLVITGASPKRVLIRGVGPALTQLGVTSALADPVLSVYNSQGQMIAQNDSWENPVTVNGNFPGATAGSVSEASVSSGAFALSSGSRDAAVILTLAPGNYTVQISGVGSTRGVGLVEVYELP